MKIKFFKNLSNDIRIIKRGHLNFIFNYGKKNIRADIPKNGKILIGSKNIKPADFCIWT